VESIDTYEHITEFGSAADHSLTVQKWQEMGVPLTTPSVKRVGTGAMTSQLDFGRYEDSAMGSQKSVFEDDIDSTVPAQDGLKKDDDARWKFEGPWLAGLNEGDFITYVSKVVRRKKPEFQKFLREACAIAATQEIRASAREEGNTSEPIQASDITDEQLDSYVKYLRSNNIQLNSLIRQFLGLPPSPNPTPADLLRSFNEDGITTPTIKMSDMAPTTNSPYAETGPPATHPSAGLAYSRTSSYLFNHPKFGPQKTKPPVQARVVMPKNAAGLFAPLLGVGGFAVDVPYGNQSFKTNKKNMNNRGNSRIEEVPGLTNIQPDVVGGSKVWVQPMSASIDPKGKVVLKVMAADEEAVAVKTDTTDQIPPRETLPPRQSSWNNVPSRASRSAYQGSYGASRSEAAPGGGERSSWY